MNENRSPEQPDPNAKAEEYRQMRQQLNDLPPNSPEYPRLRSAANRGYERFVGDLHKVTPCQKPALSYNLPSEQIVQARSEAKAALDSKVFKAVIKGKPDLKIEHYANKVYPKVTIDACQFEAKGKKRKSNIDPVKMEIYFPEQSGDIPIDPTDADSPTILDCLPDKRSGNIDRTNLVLLDLELICKGMTMKSRPDVTLFDCLYLITCDYSFTDIATYFAPDYFTKKQFDAFYSAINKWLHGKKVRKLLGDYLEKVIIIYLFLTIDFIDF